MPPPLVGGTTYATDLEVTLYRSGSGGAADANLAYVVNAEYAAFFALMDGADLRTAKYAFYGANTPARVVDAMRAAELEATYAIPAGGAQGIAWNSGKAQDYFLHNRTPGALGADFGAAQVTLNLTVGAVDGGGAYTENFLVIANYEMTIAGNIFNNHHCSHAGGNSVVSCAGTFTYANTYLPDYDANGTNANHATLRVRAGGAFYGDRAQEVAGAIAHHYSTTNINAGSRLQFLGIAPATFALTSSQVTHPASLAPLPVAQLNTITIGTPDTSYTAPNTAVAKAETTIAQVSATVDGSIVLPGGATAEVWRQGRRAQHLHRHQRHFGRRSQLRPPRSPFPIRRQCQPLPHEAAHRLHQLPRRHYVRADGHRRLLRPQVLPAAALPCGQPAPPHLQCAGIQLPTPRTSAWMSRRRVCPSAPTSAAGRTRAAPYGTS